VPTSCAGCKINKKKLLAHLIRFDTLKAMKIRYYIWIQDILSYVQLTHREFHNLSTRPGIRAELEQSIPSQALLTIDNYYLLHKTP